MTRPFPTTVEILEDAIKRAVAAIDDAYRPRFEEARAKGWRVQFAMLLEARAQDVEAATKPLTAAYAALPIMRPIQGDPQ